MTTFRALAAAFLCAASAALAAAAPPAPAAPGSLLFVRDGRIYTSDPDGKNAAALTARAEAITDLSASPSGKFAAYRILVASGTKLADGSIVERPRYELTIASLPRLKTLDTLSRDNPSVSRWTGEDFLVFFRNSETKAVPAVIHPELGEIKRYSPELYSSTEKPRLSSIDEAGGWGLVAMVKGDLKTLVNAEYEVVYALSPDAATAAYIYVSDDQDILIVHDLAENRRTKIFQAPAARKDRSELAWSRDGKFLGYFNGGEILIFDPSDAFEPTKIAGWRASWGPGRLLYAVDRRGLVRHDVVTGQSTVVVPGVKIGQYVPAPKAAR